MEALGIFICPWLAKGCNTNTFRTTSAQKMKSTKVQNPWRRGTTQVGLAMCI